MTTHLGSVSVWGCQNMGKKQRQTEKRKQGGAWRLGGGVQGKLERPHPCFVIIFSVARRWDHTPSGGAALEPPRAQRAGAGGRARVPRRLGHPWSHPSRLCGAPREAQGD